MNAARTLPMPAAPLNLPPAVVSVEQCRTPIADWDREQVRDAAYQAIADDDAYELCGHSDLVMRMCKEIEALEIDLDRARDELARADRVVVNQQAEIRDLRCQLSAERATSSGLRNEVNKLRVATAKLQNDRVTVELERLTVTLTGASSAELSARLNDQIRSNRRDGFDVSDVIDTVVIDVDAADVATEDLAVAS